MQAVEADAALMWPSPIADDDAWVQRGHATIRDLQKSGSTVFQQNSIWDVFEKDAAKWTIDEAIRTITVPTSVGGRFTRTVGTVAPDHCKDQV